MKKSVKYCCIVVVLAILVAIYTFVLINSGFIFINPETSVLFYFTAITISTALLISLMRMQCSYGNRIKNDYCYCGYLATIGATGTILLAFLTSLSECGCDFQFYAGIALLFFFIVLMLGGIVCLLYTLNTCHHECSPEKSECRTNYEKANVHEYNRNEFIYQNNSKNRR